MRNLSSLNPKMTQPSPQTKLPPHAHSILLCDWQHQEQRRYSKPSQAWQSNWSEQETTSPRSHAGPSVFPEPAPAAPPSQEWLPESTPIQMSKRFASSQKHWKNDRFRSGDW